MGGSRRNGGGGRGRRNTANVEIPGRINLHFSPPNPLKHGVWPDPAHTDTDYGHLPPAPTWPHRRGVWGSPGPCPGPCSPWAVSETQGRVPGVTAGSVSSVAGGLAAFRAFLQSEHSEENIDFWVSCEDYKRTKAPSRRGPKAKKIYEEFIAVQAAKEVGLRGTDVGS